MRKKRSELWIGKMITTVAVACILSAGTVQAATIQDVRMSGWDALPQEYKEYFEAGIRDIPEEVARLYRMRGGRIYFVPGMLSPAGKEEDPSVMGLYWYNSFKIELTTNSKWPANYIQTNAAHELGHYLYDETYSLWPQKTKEQLSAQYAYWKRYAVECTDEVETFAHLYAMYRGINSQYISQECKDMIEEAEAQCVWIYNRNTGGKWQEKGPGVELLDGLEGGNISVDEGQGAGSMDVATGT